MSTDQKRVGDLLMRAGHPNTPEQEARTCAYLAARQAFEAKLVLVADEELGSLRRSLTSSSAALKMLGAKIARLESENAALLLAVGRVVESRPEHKHRASRRKRKSAPSHGGALGEWIESPKAGLCYRCLGVFYVGDKVLLHSDGRAECLYCGDGL